MQLLQSISRKKLTSTLLLGFHSTILGDMKKPTFLSNQFLIAMPNLMDPNFFHSVTYICEHNEFGAMGVVINQQVNMTIGQLMESIGVETPFTQHLINPVYRGGPVDPDCGFVLHSPTGDWQSTLHISDDIALSTSRDIISAIAKNEGPTDYLVALGYAGWGAGQLEHEIAENAWLTVPAIPEIIFHTESDLRWTEAARLLGVEFSRLSEQVGHA